jgi:hypothetical protein
MMGTYFEDIKCKHTTGSFLFLYVPSTCLYFEDMRCKHTTAVCNDTNARKLNSLRCSLFISYIIMMGFHLDYKSGQYYISQGTCS